MPHSVSRTHLGRLNAVAYAPGDLVDPRGLITVQDGLAHPRLRRYAGCGLRRGNPGVHRGDSVLG